GRKDRAGIDLVEVVADHDAVVAGAAIHHHWVNDRVEVDDIRAIVAVDLNRTETVGLDVGELVRHVVVQNGLPQIPEGIGGRDLVEADADHVAGRGGPSELQDTTRVDAERGGGHAAIFEIFQAEIGPLAFAPGTTRTGVQGPGAQTTKQRGRRHGSTPR